MQIAGGLPSGTDVLAGVALVPLIIGLNEVAKGAGLDKKYAPILALVLGVVFELAYTLVAVAPLTGKDIGTAIFAGLAAGLASSGFYSGIGQPAIKAMQINNPNIKLSQMDSNVLRKVQAEHDTEGMAKIREHE